MKFRVFGWKQSRTNWEEILYQKSCDTWAELIESIEEAIDADSEEVVIRVIRRKK